MIWYALATLFPTLSLTTMAMQLWGARVMRLGSVVPTAGMLIWVAALALAANGYIPYWAFLVIGTFSSPLGGLVGANLVRPALRSRFAAWVQTCLAYKAYSELINTLRASRNREEDAREKRRIQLSFLIWAAANPFFRSRSKPPDAVVAQVRRELDAAAAEIPTARTGDRAWVRTAAKYASCRANANSELASHDLSARSGCLPDFVAVAVAGASGRLQIQPHT